VSDRLILLLLMLQSRVCGVDGGYLCVVGLVSHIFEVMDRLSVTRISPTRMLEMECGEFGS
jgi:hypothetical protein